MNITCITRIAARQLTRPLAIAIACLGAMPSGSTALAQNASTIQHNGQSFPVVQASEANALFDFPAMEQAASQSEIAQVAYHGGGYSSGVTMSGALTGPGISGNACNNACSMACPTCEPFCYVRAETVYVRREDLDNYTLSRNFALDEYDFEWAPRITIGTCPDCVTGSEFTFVGPLTWSTSDRILNVNGQTILNERINPALLGNREEPIRFTFLYDPEAVVDPNADPLVFTDDPNDPVNLQAQRYESTYWSAGTSRTMMAWDVAKLSIGGNYVNFEEEYGYLASNGAAAVDNGGLTADTTNRMMGIQVGIDMYSPICRFGSTFMRARAGGYLNQSEATVTLIDQGEVLYRANDDDIGLAGMFEISNGIQYQLGEILSVHAGSEFWYLTEVATVERNIPSLVGERAGTRRIENGDDVIFVGFSFGATLKY